MQTTISKPLRFLIKPFFAGLFFLFSITSFAQAGGLVPCGRSTNDERTPWNDTDPCSLCHFAILVQNIINFLMNLIGILTVLAILFGGLTYVLAVGNPGIISKAKSTIQWALGGFVLTLTAWLIVNTILLTMGYAKPIGGGNDWYRLDIDCPNSTTTTTITTPAATPAPTGEGGSGGSGGGGAR